MWLGRAEPPPAAEGRKELDSRLAKGPSKTRQKQRFSRFFAAKREILRIPEFLVRDPGRDSAIGSNSLVRLWGFRFSIPIVAGTLPNEPLLSRDLIIHGRVYGLTPNRGSFFHSSADREVS